MKIERTKLRSGTSDVPTECQLLIDRLKSCSKKELMQELMSIDSWVYGKCELYHWIDVLNVFDEILEEAASVASVKFWELSCDVNPNKEDKELLLWVLHFTTLLIEHSFSRHLYNSMEHLITLLSSCDMNVVLGVLNLLYAFSKRSNFLSRLNSVKRSTLICRLTHLAESWGGKENGFGLAECCQDLPMLSFPPGATTLHFEYSSDAPSCQSTGTKNKNSLNQITCIHLERVDLIKSSPAEIVKDLITLHNVPVDRQMSLFTNVRLAHCFSDYKKRLLCVRARLQALSILVYSNALQTNAHSLLYSGLLEELVEVLELPYPHLVEIRAAALRTLTSITHFDRNPQYPRLNTIIDVTGASSYHGFLPVLVRNCIASLTSHYTWQNTNVFPLPLATSILSFLYHLSSYEAGGEALVNCGMMECLLRVIDWPGKETEHVTFVTRAVRVIDLITNIDMQAFQTHGGLTSFINRLEMEVEICRNEQPFEIKPPNSSVGDDYDVSVHVDENALPQGEIVNGMHDTQSSDIIIIHDSDSMDVVEVPPDVPNTVAVGTGKIPLPDYSAAKTGKTCLPQRAALLKSMLNFLKKAIQDSSMTDSIRHVMGESLPSSLKHIISNAEYYGASLFLLATDIVTVFVFQEPSLLSSLQDNGLTDVVLHALLVKDVPATREVLGSLPNVFSALCLNARGLASFVQCQPFERLFKVLLSPVYLSSMRRRRNSDPNGDTASNLGNAMDELMRHQPSLKVDATAAIIKLLEELCALGRDPKYVCWWPQNKTEFSPVVTRGGNGSNRGNEGGGGSSDEEDEEEEDPSAASATPREDSGEHHPNEKIPIPLIDYILNVMKFVDAILSNNSTDDHCLEFVAQGGLTPLISILGLPNLPSDHPTTALAMAVSAPIKSILNLAHEREVLREGLKQLNEILKILEPLHQKCDPPRSALLHELAEAPDLETAFVTPSSTPLLHAVAAAHGYIVMFMLLSRTGEIEIRSLTVHYWGSELGVATLKGLSDLYTSLVWESTLLLSLINGDTIPSGFDFCKEDLDKVKPPDFRGTGESWGSAESGSSNVNCMAMDSEGGLGMEFESDSRASGKPKTGKSYALAQQIKYIKPLLSASSRLGRVLAELLGLMVKVCYGQFSTGSPLRQRRGQQLLFQMASSSHQAKIIADTLTDLLRRSISWSELPPSPLPKFRLTFLVCTLGFTSPILFDEKKYPYHAMLQRFVSLGGLSAYFDIYHWALTACGKHSRSESIEVTDLPDGTGEFIDSWLMLLEKFVNARLIFDTPNYLAKSDVSSSQLSFPLRFLIHIHKLGFSALSSLWGKKPLPKYGSRITESMLSIYRHIIKGEKFIQDKLAKRKECISIGEGTSKRGREEGEPEVNLNHVQQLMDMGFKREHCVEALLHTSGLEQATDYLLSNPPPSRSSQIQSMDLDMSEDDQVQRAIAMSLGEDTAPSVDKKKDFFLERDIFDDIPLEKEALDHFTSTAFEVCLKIADDIPDTVYRISELLGTIIKRNGSNYLDGILNILKEQLVHSLNGLIRAAMEENPSSVARTVQSSPVAVKVGTRAHLFMLLMEEMRVQCSAVAQKAQLLSRLVQFLVVGHSHIESTPPRWMSPILLLIDLLLRISVYSDRKNKMHKITSRTWKWYDLGSGRWARYTPSIDKIINDAYFSGESSVRIVVNRRKYTIQFGSMLQVNDETGNRRPVMMSLKQDRTLFSKYEQMINDGGKQEDSSENLDESLYDTEESKRNIVLTGLSHSESEHLTRVCVELLKNVHDGDTVNALLRICLRLTRDYEIASLFAEMGGVKILLGLKMESMFTGALNVITLLIRHVIEEPRLLIIAIEKVLRSRTLPNIPPCYKELIYMMRMCSSAVCREPVTFVEVAKSILRVDTSILSRKNLGHLDERLLVKSLPPKTYQPDSYMDEISKKAIADLLDALIVHVPDDEPMVIDSPATQATPPPGYIQVDNCGAFGRNIVNNAVAVLDSNSEVSPVKYSVKRKIPDDPTEMTDEEKRKPLLPKSSILKIISDVVRSYPPCSKQVTRHRFQEGQSDLVPESYSALGFIIDKLLPVDAESDDKECSTMARMLLSSIASCNQCIEGQVTIVQEIRCALQRALSLPETPEKHAHIQLLCGLMSTLIENCPPAPPNTPISFKFCPFSNVSHMVRIMQRKGLVTDLARIPSHLDLSSPNMAPTMNAVLKPLETLTRLLSQPPANTGKPKPKPVESMTEDPLGPQSGTTTSESTRANREETMEDAENTENDISVAGESLEQHSGYQATSQGMEEGDEEIMERPLIRDTSEVEIGDTRERVRVEGRTVSRVAVAVSTSDTPSRAHTSMEFAGDDTQDDDSEHSRDEEDDDEEDDDEEDDDEDDDDEDDKEEEEEISPLRDTSEVEIGDTRERVRVEGRTVSRVDVAVSTSDTPSRTHNSMEFVGDDTQDDDPADSGDTDSEHSREVEDDDDEEDDDEEDEEEVEEEEEDEEVEEDNNDDDDDAGSGYGGDVMETMEPDGFFRIPGLEREREDILMIQYSDPDDIVVNQGSTPGHDFTRRNMNDASLTSRESQRGIGARRYQYLRMAARNTNPPPPVILQRLLGPSAHDLPMSTGQAFIPGYRDTRVVVMDNGLGIFTNPEEEQIDFVDQSGYLFGPSLAATLNNIPTSLHWWNEESKLLDGESAADCVTIVYSSLEAFLDHQRNVELMEHKTVADRKEKLARETMGIEISTKKDESSKADNSEEVTVLPRTSTPRENPDVISVESNESQAEITFENLVDRDLDLRSLVETNEFQTNEMVAHALDLPSPIPTIITTGRSIPEAETIDASTLETSMPCARDNNVHQNRRPSVGSVASARVRSSRRAACSGSDASRRGTHSSGPSSRRLRSRDIPAPTAALTDSQDQPRPSEPESEDADIVYLGTFRDTSASQTIGNPSASQYSVILPISAQRTDHNVIGAQGSLPFGCPHDASSGSVNHLYFSARHGADEAIESADNEVQIIEPSELSSNELSHPVQLTPQQTACQGRSFNHSGHRSHSLSPDINTFGINSSSSQHTPATYSDMPAMNDSVVDLRPVILNVMSVTENNQMGVADLANDWSRFQLQADDDSMVLTESEQQVSTSTIRGGPSNSASETERTVSQTQRALTRYVQVDHDYGVDSLPVESLLGTVSEDGGSDGNSLNMPVVRSGLVGNVILPEGVDPSFLAALPEEMREEVVAEQVRLQQMRQRAQTQAATDESIAEVPVAEVNPDFLAALPPNIQEEVLAQQRVEQQRQAAAAANPDEPVDAVAFFQNLPPTLRTQILSDMEESQISALSPELAAEAADLRRQLESRNRQLMQERFFSHVNHNNSALSSILRNTGRVGTRYAIHTVPQQQWRSWASRGETLIPAPSATSGLTASGAMVGPCYHHCTRNRFLLDQETMTCLLVLLFVDEPRLNSGRLHRVVRNLCFNPTTREWILKTLLSVFDRCGHGKLCPVEGSTSEYNTKNKRQSSRLLQQAQNLEHSGCCTPRSADVRTMVPTWLNIGVDAALGCRANIFSVQRPTGKRGIDKLGAASAAAATLTIHPLAAPTVCKHTLELLISLAKLFPSYYLPMKTHEIESMPKDLSTKDNERFKLKLQAVYAGNGGGLKSKVGPTNFWELLVKLDMMSASKKGKNNCRSYYTLTPPMEFDYFNLSFETSAFGHLVAMFSYPVIRCSTMLTDKLLRLLSLISLGLPDSSPQARKRDRDVMETAEDTDEKREYNQRMKVSEEYIKLAIEVLTSKSCSEEGLEDATSLLLNWSYGPAPTRDMILRLLLDGAQELGNVVCRQISTLLKELRMLKRKSRREKNRPVSSEENPHDRQPTKGVLHDRFTKSTVVVTAPTKVKHGSDLQIPAMIPLTSKTSSQIFFLRTLKVIIQLREAIQLSIKKNKRKGTQEAGDLETRPATVTENFHVTSIANGNEDSMVSEQQRPMHVDSQEGSPAQSVIPAQRAVGQRECVAAQLLHSPREATSLEERVPQRSDVTNSGPVSEIERGSSSQDPANESSSSTASFATQAGPAGVVLPNLSEQLCLDELWKVLTDCLLELQDTPDHHAVLVLQPAVEAFFLIHASSDDEKEQKSTEEPRSTPECRVSAAVQVQHELAPVSPLPAEGDAPPVLNFLWESPPSTTTLSNDTVKFLKFAETHRTVLNQILRQSTSPLSEGPFAVLVDHTRILDFDVKRKYFRAELERLDDGMRREELAIHVRRSCVFEDSFRELHRRRADDWKNRFYIVFEGEEGQDAGGLLREWYVIISRDIFNPNYALFTSSFGDRATYTINPASHYNPHHLCYFKFVGRTIAKAINDNKLLECYFTRSFYKHILGIPLKYTDMESEDYSFYKGLKFLMENHVNTLGEITFSTEVQEFGVTEVRDLIPNGRNIVVSEANKMDYVRLVCQMKMTGAIMKQLGAFLEGFYDIIPKKLISIFNEQELELLISGLPNIDIDELRANTEYHKYQASSLQIKWFWRALRSFEQADRAKFLQFVTGTSKVPLQGFAALEGMNGIQKFQIHRDERSTDRLPSAHTCFNQLDLPVYETYDKLRRYLLKAIQECSEGFGFA